MLDNIILAYRNKFYDWSLKEVAEFYTKNKKLFWWLIFIILAIVGASIYSILHHLSQLLYFIIPIELILGIVGDRFTVKRYHKFISSKQEHIEEVVSFLKTAVPNCNLFSKKQIEYLLNRLTARIESKAPYNKFKTGLSSFGKAIIIPIITYVAGIYSNSLVEIEPSVAIVWSISVIITIFFCYITFGILSQGLQKITCRNYDAAIALKEDLLDIILLFFSSADF